MGYKHLMLVEGADDQHAIGYILEHYSIDCCPIKYVKSSQDKKIVIKDSGGVDDLLASLPIYLEDGNIQCLAVVLDADTNLQTRWEGVCEILNESGKTDLPENPNPAGTTTTIEQEGRNLKVGIWVMPNNQITGILEDFIQHLVPEDDDLWDYAVNSVRNIKENNRRFPLVRQSKAEIHTWLAWQNEPGKSLGIAIASKYLDPTKEQGALFVEWVQNTFDL